MTDRNTLLGLADQYASLLVGYHSADYVENLPTEQDVAQAKQALSDAIDAALAQARRDALEEAAKEADIWPFGVVAAAIRALKEKA